MRPSQLMCFVFLRAIHPEVIELSSDSEDELEDEPGPEIISISSDSEEMEDQVLEEPEQEDLDILSVLEGGDQDIELEVQAEGEPEEPEQEEFDILPDLEEGEIREVPDIPTVANQVRIGFWCNGFWCTPGNRLNYVNPGEGYGVWSLNEPPMDGVEGGLSYVGERNLSKPTLGQLLYNQWLQNREHNVAHQVTLGESVYNSWLDSRNTE